MASKRAVLETLKLKELVSMADAFDLKLENRRKKDSAIDALAKTRKVKLSELLSELPLATLKSACSNLGITASGRSKAIFIDALVTVTSAKAPAKKKAAAKPKAEKAPVKKKAVAKPKAEKATAKKKAAAKPKAEKAPAKQKAAAKPKAEKAPIKKKAVAKPKAEKTPVKKLAAVGPKNGEAPAKAKEVSKRKVKIISAAAVSEERVTDPEPRQAVLDKVAGIKPAETSQPDYAQIKREPTGLDIKRSECPSCNDTIQVATCQAHKCTNRYIFVEQRKICASCWYERSSVSIGEYLDEDKIDTHCPACNEEITAEEIPTLSLSA